jgi:hypothetical protein
MPKETAIKIIEKIQQKNRPNSAVAYRSLNCNVGDKNLFGVDVDAFVAASAVLSNEATRVQYQSKSERQPYYLSQDPVVNTGGNPVSDSSNRRPQPGVVRPLTQSSSTPFVSSSAVQEFGRKELSSAQKTGQCAACLPLGTYVDAR